MSKRKILRRMDRYRMSFTTHNRISSVKANRQVRLALSKVLPKIREPGNYKRRLIHRVMASGKTREFAKIGILSPSDYGYFTHRPSHIK